MTDLDTTMDESWSPYGLLKVVRAGMGYEWQVFGRHNYETPLFSGHCGQFFEAKNIAEERLYKDLRQIFWILNEMSQKERKEGEPQDAEIIEQAIRSLNVGDKKKAIAFLTQIIGKERAEREPEDVAKLEQARALVLAEKGIEKDTKCPGCGRTFSSEGKTPLGNRVCRACGSSEPEEKSVEKTVKQMHNVDPEEVQAEVQRLKAAGYYVSRVGHIQARHREYFIEYFKEPE